MTANFSGPHAPPPRAQAFGDRDDPGGCRSRRFPAGPTATFERVRCGRREPRTRTTTRPPRDDRTGPYAPAPVSRVVVITGPSGAGKGTLIRLLREQLPGLGLSVSATTRDPRPGEADGVDYRFLSDAEFDRRVAAGEFVEHAEYAGRKYGTLRSELDARTAAGEPVVLEIEVQGARQIRDAVPGALLVFIAPPSEEALRERLVGRGTDVPEVVERRLGVAREELAARGEFAHVVVNDRLEEAVRELVSVVREGLGGPVD